MKTYIVKFYHTEAMYKAGIVSWSMTRHGAREAIYNEAKALKEARRDFAFEIEEA